MFKRSTWHPKPQNTHTKLREKVLQHKDITWKCTALFMMTSLNGNILRVSGHLCGDSPAPDEFPAQRPVMRSFDVFFDLRLNKRLSKQSWGWLFETPSCPLWRHSNEIMLTSWHGNAIHITDRFEGHPSVKDGFPAQRVSNAGLWFFVVILDMLKDKQSNWWWWEMSWLPYDVTVMIEIKTLLIKFD